MPYQPLFPETGLYRPIYPQTGPTLGGEEIEAQGGSGAVERRPWWDRMQDYGDAARTSFGKALKSSLWDVTRIPETLAELQLAGKKALLPKALEPFAEAQDRPALNLLNALTPGFVKEGRDRAVVKAKEAQVAKAEAGLEAGIPDWLQVTQNFGEDFASMALDPLELLPGGLAVEGAQALSRGRKAAKPAAKLATALARTEPDDVIRAFDETYFDREIPKATMADRVVDLGQKLRFELEDEYQPILRMVRQTRDPEKVQIAEELIQQVRGAPVRSEVPVLRQTMRYDPVADADIPTGPGLLDVMKGHSEDALLDAERLMAAQRNLELAERAAAGERLKVSPESVEDSNALLAALSAKHGGDLSELQGIADAYRDWSRRAFLEPLKGAGILTDEAIGRMLAKGEQYTIFRRVEQMMEELGIDLKMGEKIPKGGEVAGGGPLAGSPIKGIHEGLSKEGKLTGIFESSALQAMRIQRFVDRQHVKNMLGRLADEFPDEVPVRRLPKVQRPVATVENALGEPETVFRAQEQGKGFVRYEDGVRIEYDAPGDVLDALGRLAPKQAMTGLGVARFATRLLRAGTVETPAFAVYDALRNIQQYAIYSRAGVLPGYDVARVTGREIASRLRGRGPTPAWEAASSMGFSGVGDVDRTAVRSLQKEAHRLGTAGGRAKRFLREWKSNPLLPFQVLVSLTDRLPRLAEADLILAGGRKKVLGLPIPGTKGRGGPPGTARAAGYGSADLMNFARGGRAGKSYSRYEAFVNVQLQDASKFAREMRQRPFETTVKAMAYAGIPAALNFALNKDDPEYQELPEWDKALSYHLGKYPNGWWIRFPRGLGLATVIFGYGTEKTLEALHSDDPRQFEKVMEGLSAATPLGYIDEPLNVIPTALQPLTEASPGVNRSAFRKRPIVPRSREDYPAREQIGPYTSPSMIGLGNALTTPLSPEGVSPERLQYVYEQHTGTLGREALSLADRGMEALGRPEARRRISSPKDIPILGRFTSKPGRGFSTESVERFYDYASEADGAYRLLRKDTLRGLPYSNKAKLAPAMRQGQKALSMISDRLNEIRDDPNLPEEEKKKRIEALEEKASTLARRLVKLYESRVNP